MGSAKIYILNEIKNQIPYEILNAAFTIDEDPNISTITTLEEKIDTKVLKQRVYIDLNIFGGVENVIPINGLMPTYRDRLNVVYKIPPQATANKEIISVLSLTYLPYVNYYNLSYPHVDTLNYNNPVTSVTDRVYSASNPSLIINNAHTELIGYNTVLIRSPYQIYSNFALRVVLANDENLNNISPRSYKVVANLSVYATKAYIYNKLIIPINSGYLASGQDLGVFKSIIESYSDAYEAYNTYLKEVVGAVMFMNDTTRYNRFLSSMIAPDL